MTPDVSTVRGVADKALHVIAKVRPGSSSGRRSLPIRCDAEEISARWDDPQQRAAILEGIPVADASLMVGDQVNR